MDTSEADSAGCEMDGVSTGKPCPMLKASIFSYVTWQWMQSFITAANKKPLQAEDLYDLMPDETALHCEQRWLKALQDERSKSSTGRKPISVWKLLYKSMGCKFMVASLLKPVWLVAVVLQVYILKELVEIAKDKASPLEWWWAAVLVLGMLVTSTVQSICQHMCFTMGQRTGLKARATVAMAVFNKLQEMRLASLVSTNTGIMLNLVTNDTQKILDAAMFFHYVWTAVMEVAVVSGLVLYEAGIAAIPGVVIIFLTQPLQVAMAQRVGRLRRTAVTYTDSRVRSVNEILTGVRVVKYNGWTAAFLKRIGDLRASELHWIKRANYLRASTSTLRDGVTPVASLATFGTYVAIHGGAALTPSLAFTILALFSILVRLFSIAPLGVQHLFEALVAIQRLQQLLDLPNGRGLGTNIFGSENDEDLATTTTSPVAVSVSGGIFSWRLKEWHQVYASSRGGNKDSKEEGLKTLSRKLGKIKQNSVQGLKVPDLMNQLNPSDSSKGKLSVQEGEAAATLKGITLKVRQGEHTAIVGAVGSGKSSLLLALLGEMECLAGESQTERPVAYAPQQPWVLNDTIRNNILFGSKFDAKRYNVTVTACALDHDIAQLPAGHETEIGERGVNLSGGQRARVCLARACYSACPVLLLDDPLAAVDGPTAKHLMDHVLSPERSILKDRAIILVTHNKTSLRYCDRVLLMDHGSLQEIADVDDVVLFEGKVSLDHDASNIANKVVQHPAENVQLDDPDQSVDDSASTSGSGVNMGDNIEIVGKKTGSVTVKEDRVEGEVTWAVYIQYAKDGGGLVVCVLVVLVFFLAQAVRVMVDYWLSVWVDGKYRNLSTTIYVVSYACFCGGAIAFSIARALLFTEAAMSSAKQMHGRMAEGVLRSPQLFFDQNPVGRIVNRFGKDQAMVDELLPSTAQTCLESFVGCLGSMAIIAVLIPWFLLCVPPFALVFFYLQRRYVTVSRELKRLDGLSRSPMYAHLDQTLQGIASVRAFGAEKRMHDQFIAMIDTNHRAFILFVHASRWLGVRLDFAAAICVAIASLLVVLLRHSISPGLAGVVLVQSLQLTGFFQYGVRLAADTENFFTSVERIQAYSNLPTEADPDTAPGVIAPDWPQMGKIEFVHYTMAYRLDLPPVLNDLCFRVKAQEKVGILGRTGAGKSSLAAAMFRLVENRACSGSILIDGIDITHVGLDDLRRRLSIIPQDPVLFRGTVRLNLDPFEQHTDTEINEAVARVHLSKKIATLDSGLDSVVTENGENFSVGERQLLCLARSLLRRSCVIVMDEATAAVDGETDQLIQTTMRGVFHRCTVLTIAHRIDTIIDCDRVLVLAKGGRVAEFDTPANLLRRAENSTSSQAGGSYDHGFADIVAQSGAVIAKQLREAAEAAELKRCQDSQPEVEK